MLFAQKVVLDAGSSVDQVTFPTFETFASLVQRSQTLGAYGLREIEFLLLYQD